MDQDDPTPEANPPEPSSVDAGSPEDGEPAAATDSPAEPTDPTTVEPIPADAAAAAAATEPPEAAAAATEPTEPAEPTDLSWRSSRILAAVLSFLVPGTGQLLTGRLLAGLLFLSPVIVAVVAAVVASGGDRGRLLGYLVQPGVLLGIVILDGVLLAWRALAIVDAWWGRHSKAPKTVFSVITLVALLALTGATHFVIGAQVMAARDTVEAVFASSDDEGDDGFGEIPEETEAPSPTPTPLPTATPEPGATAAPTPSPTPTPAPTPVPGPLTDGRLDVLLVGGDAGPGRWSLRTDTLMVLSVDTETGDSALFSIPRNMVNVPLPKESRNAFACRCFPRLINSLYVYASSHPGSFPGKDDTRGLRAVQMAIGTLVGRKLDGMVVVKLQGFVKLVNAIGGIDVTVPEAVFDERYPLENGNGYVQIYIKRGKQHMTGRKALMYARSRHQDSDYGRMERQQIVLTAIGKKLLKEPLLIRLPDLLDIAKNNLWTNLKKRDLPDLATPRRAGRPQGDAEGALHPAELPRVPQRRRDQEDPERGGPCLRPPRAARQAHPACATRANAKPDTRPSLTVRRRTARLRIATETAFSLNPGPDHPGFFLVREGRGHGTGDGSSSVRRRLGRPRLR